MIVEDSEVLLWQWSAVARWRQSRSVFVMTISDPTWSLFPSEMVKQDTGKRTNKTQSTSQWSF